MLPALFDHFAKRLGTTGCEKQRLRIHRASVRHDSNNETWTKTMSLLQKLRDNSGAEQKVVGPRRTLVEVSKQFVPHGLK